MAYFINIDTQPQAHAVMMKTRAVPSDVSTVIAGASGPDTTSARTGFITISHRRGTASYVRLAPLEVQHPLVSDVHGSAGLVSAVARALPIDEKVEASLRQLAEAAMARRTSRPLRR